VAQEAKEWRPYNRQLRRPPLLPPLGVLSPIRFQLAANLSLRFSWHPMNSKSSIGKLGSVATLPQAGGPSIMGPSPCSIATHKDSSSRQVSSRQSNRLQPRSPNSSQRQEALTGYRLAVAAIGFLPQSWQLCILHALLRHYLVGGEWSLELAVRPGLAIATKGQAPGSCSIMSK